MSVLVEHQAALAACSRSWVWPLAAKCSLVSNLGSSVVAVFDWALDSSWFVLMVHVWDDSCHFSRSGGVWHADLRWQGQRRGFGV